MTKVNRGRARWLQRWRRAAETLHVSDPACAVEVLGRVERLALAVSGRADALDELRRLPARKAPLAR